MLHPALTPKTASPPTPAPLRVALIEDDAPLRAVLTEVFADEGWGVTTHRTLAEALAELRPRPPDVIVTDGMGSGVRELTAGDRASIRAVAGVAPTIVCSGRAWASTLAPGELGLAGLLVKPVHLGELCAAVRRAAGRTD